MNFKVAVSRERLIGFRELNWGGIAGRLRGTYWQSLAISTIGLLLALTGIGLVLGLPLKGLTALSTELAALQIVSLFVLFWPVLSVSIRRLSDRAAHRCWGAAIYPVAVLALMQAHFNKPFELAITPHILPAIALLLLVLLTAWLLVETRTGDRRQA